MERLSRRQFAVGSLAAGLGVLVRPADAVLQEVKPQPDLEQGLTARQAKLLADAKKAIEDSRSARLKHLLADATEPSIRFDPRPVGKR